MPSWERAIKTYQSKDPSPTKPTHRMKDEQWKTAGDEKEAIQFTGDIGVPSHQNHRLQATA